MLRNFTKSKKHGFGDFLASDLTLRNSIQTIILYKDECANALGPRALLASTICFKQPRSPLLATWLFAL